MQHAPITKYQRHPVIQLPDRSWANRNIADIPAPIWCSVDLRDGNQALPIPMGVAEKLEMFRLLVRLGFKEIEIGFPAASNTEFAFCRRLIEENLIPEDVSVQVLVQCREHLIERTFEALEGAVRPIVHIYNSTSPLQRRVTFAGASRADIRRIAEDGAHAIKKRAHHIEGLRLEYSPESFSDTEPDFALEVCEAVAAIWEASPANPIILNLPETVQWTTPNVYADRIEWFIRNLKNPDAAIVSLHTHNDRGTGTAATELGLLAGARRVEGTLFGNGERTGNLDIVTVALNLYTHGVDPKLAFDDLPAIRAIYERCTRMSVHERHPYSGDLVFTAFSGSHQDAIKKGLDLRHAANADAAAANTPDGDSTPWAVPYLTIDPTDIGGTHDALIRINSQSGKGGVAFVLAREFRIDLPKLMHPQVGDIISAIADKAQRDLTPAEIHDLFRKHFVNLAAPLAIESFSHHETTDTATSAAAAQPIIHVTATIRHDGQPATIHGQGNGPLDALANALGAFGIPAFSILDYRSHALDTGAASESAAYVCIRRASDNAVFWGCGFDTNIETAGVRALVSAHNRAAPAK